MHTKEIEADFIRSLTALAQLAHANSRNKGFWTAHDRIKDLLMVNSEHSMAEQFEILWKLSRHDLIHSETSEATEGVRKDLRDDHLPHRTMEVAELADTIIRILDYAGAYNLPLAETILEKMAYNTERPFMHGDKRA